MISISVGRGNQKAFLSIDNAIPKIRKGIRKALTEIGKENVRFAKSLIKNPPKTGRRYMIDGKQHRASAPGEAPAQRTKKLGKGVQFRVYGWERMEFGDTVLYGVYLELGTKNMHPREHLIRTIRVKQRDNYNSLQSVVRNALL